MSDSSIAEFWLFALQQRLQREFTLTPVVATEIEFYLQGADALADDAALLTRLQLLTEREGIGTHFPEKETAPEQFEIALCPSADLQGLAHNTERMKAAIVEDMAMIGIQASFAAKPFDDRAGSGFHLHLHLEDETGRNVFWRTEADEYSEALNHAIGGLLDALPASMPFFAPYPESYRRFAPEERAPTHVSWGPNNRTAALRLPPKPLDDKHLEHRVPGADANPTFAIGALLMGVHWGLARGLSAPEPVHGEAHKSMYGLPKLPETLDQAQALFAGSIFAEHYPLVR